MPSWVVPAVAAELWNVSLQHVMSEVAAGRLATRVEGELLFVDVDPSSGSPDADFSPAPAPYRRPLAWAFAAGAAQPIVTAAERDALLAHADDGNGNDDDDDDSPPDDDVPPPMALTADDVPDWEQVRARVSRNRRPPAAREAA